MSLRLGKELFDINQSIDMSGSIPRQSVGSNASQSLSQSQTRNAELQSQTQAGIKSQGLTYLVAQHKRAQVLQSEALITGYMTLRPTGMQSETHRMLVRAVGQKHNKVARLRMAPDPDKDPEREKLELMKQSAKKSKKKVDPDDGFGGRRRRTPYSRKRAGHDVWSDDDGQEGHGPVGSDEEGDDDGSGRGSPRKEKRTAHTDGEKKGVGDYQEDDFVVADSSDEDAGSDAVRNKRKSRDDDMEEDPLDKLDAKIREQQDEQKRRQRQSGAKGPGGVEAGNEQGKEDEEEEMDVESEEEEEFKVRRVGPTGGTGVRKKRAIDFDDGEDE